MGNSGRTQEECVRAPPEPLSAQKVREVLLEEESRVVQQPFIICIQVLLLLLKLLSLLN